MIKHLPKMARRHYVTAAADGGSKWRAGASTSLAVLRRPSMAEKLTRSDLARPPPAPPPTATHRSADHRHAWGSATPGAACLARAGGRAQRRAPSPRAWRPKRRPRWQPPVVPLPAAAELAAFAPRLRPTQPPVTQEPEPNPHPRRSPSFYLLRSSCALAADLAVDGVRVAYGSLSKPAFRQNALLKLLKHGLSCACCIAAGAPQGPHGAAPALALAAAALAQPAAAFVLPSLGSLRAVG